jgi:hypothetical protein
MQGFEEGEEKRMKILEIRFMRHCVGDKRVKNTPKNER